MTDWTFSALGDVCSVNRRIKKYDDQTPVSFVGMAELDEEAALAIPREDGTFADYKTGYTLFSDGDILAAKITPCWQNAKIGIANLNHPNGVGSTEFHVLKPSPDLDSRYLLHYLRRPALISEGEARMTGSGGQRRVPANFLEKLPIPLPPLDEQRRIADILDRAQSIITTSKEKCRKVEILKSSFTESIVKSSTKRQRLEEIAEVTGGLSLNRKRQDLPQKVPYLRVANVHRGALDLSGLKHFGVSNRELERTLLLRDDILMVEAHANQFEVGRAAILNESVPGLTHQNHLFKVRSKGLPPRALEALLNSYLARRQLVKRAKTTSGLFTINISGARSLTLPVLSEQMSRTLDRRLGEISKLHADSLKRQESADQLYNSLATRAFAGEL